MAGQLGNKITTIQKLKVIQIDLEENILVRICSRKTW
jgi:ribosomal protein L3